MFLAKVFIFAVILVGHSSVLSIHIDVSIHCPPPRLVNFHIDELEGLWLQYVYQIVNGTAFLFSCENFTVTNDNGSYIGSISTPNNTGPFVITELPGPTFYYVSTTRQSYQFTELTTTYAPDALPASVKVSIANFFISGNYGVTFIILASRDEYLDPSIHEPLLHSVGFHIDPNSTVILPEECPRAA